MTVTGDARAVTIIDSEGRVVLPRQLREALGLTPGARVDISAHGPGVQITPAGTTARLERDPTGRLVSRGDTEVTDEMVDALRPVG